MGVLILKPRIDQAVQSIYGLFVGAFLQQDSTHQESAGLVLRLQLLDSLERLLGLGKVTYVNQSHRMKQPVSYSFRIERLGFLDVRPHLLVFSRLKESESQAIVGFR